MSCSCRGTEGVLYCIVVRQVIVRGCINKPSLRKVLHGSTGNECNMFCESITRRFIPSRSRAASALKRNTLLLPYECIRKRKVLHFQKQAFYFLYDYELQTTNSLRKWIPTPTMGRNHIVSRSLHLLGYLVPYLIPTLVPWCLSTACLSLAVKIFTVKSFVNHFETRF